MPFQSTVAFNQGFGIAGELFDDSPYRAEPFTIVSDDATNNVFGRAFTVTASEQGIAQAGGTGVFAGFLINPKGNTTSGTVSGGSLAPTLTIPNQTEAEILNFGCIIVSLPDAAEIGDLVMYDTTTGELSTISPGDTIPVGTAFANAVVDRFRLTSSGLAVIRVSDVPVPPVAP
jgi:structural protein gp24